MRGESLCPPDARSCVVVFVTLGLVACADIA